jgi:hypothetical protein
LPWTRFLALLHVIPALEAEEDLRALTIAAIGANPGEKAAAFRDYSEQLQRQAGLDGAGGLGWTPKDTLAPGMPGVGRLEDGNAALAELRAKRAAWFAQHGREA